MKKTKRNGYTYYSSFCQNTFTPIQFIWNKCNNGEEFISIKEKQYSTIYKFEMSFNTSNNKWKLVFHKKSKAGKDGVWDYDINSKSTQKDLNSLSSQIMKSSANNDIDM